MCTPSFIFSSAVSSSRFSSSREIRRSRIVSAFLFMRTPKRWNGDFVKSGGPVRRSRRSPAGQQLLAG
jgi:hypothetical protein